MLSDNLQLELCFELRDEAKPASSNLCYTLGYLNHDFNLVASTIKALNARLLDIRFSPCSQILEWNEEFLARYFSLSYRHIPELGNRNYKTSGPISIVNLDVGINHVLEEMCSGPVVLLCACRNFERCHRSYVAAALKAVDVKSRELIVFETEGDLCDIT